MSAAAVAGVAVPDGERAAALGGVQHEAGELGPARAGGDHQRAEPPQSDGRPPLRVQPPAQSPAQACVEAFLYCFIQVL